MRDFGVARGRARFVPRALVVLRTRRFVRYLLAWTFVAFGGCVHPCIHKIPNIVPRLVGACQTLWVLVILHGHAVLAGGFRTRCETYQCNQGNVYSLCVASFGFARPTSFSLLLLTLASASPSFVNSDNLLDMEVSCKCLLRKLCKQNCENARRSR